MDGINPRATVQRLNLDENSLRIQVPFSMSISGPSQSKKCIVKLAWLKIKFLGFSIINNI